MKFKDQKGFTLIELLVVIVIIGILATLTTVALSTARVKARDAKRISDIKQMQTALELYYNEENTYPPTSALAVGQALVGAQSLKTFMGKIPAGPNTGETYTYAQINGGTSYTLGYTLEKPVNEFAAGTAVALPGSINNQCTPSCAGKVCGPNGCGGVCSPNNCSGATPYCKTDGTACVACNADSDCSGTPTTPYCKTNACSATPDFSVACTSNSTLGSGCGGGWLICKPNGEGNCSDSPGLYVVAATSTSSGVNWTTANSNCSSYSAYGYSGWSLPRVYGTSPTLTGYASLGPNTEMCQIARRSKSSCSGVSTAGHCTGGCLTPTFTITNFGAGISWSLTEYSDSTQAFFINNGNGNYSYATKTGGSYMGLCVRRFSN
ncbi:MAG: type II secretion system protein [Patescibacteria group bacterium]|nr:type II secretion system protein [Patescibacteria group bacterium]